MKQPKDYIVFPLDVPTYDTAMYYVNLLKDYVGVFKVGLELFISEGPFILYAIRKSCNNGIFLDLKLHDIPVTVKRAVLAASKYKPEFMTIHCDEGSEALREAAENNPAEVKLLAITVLTSLGPEQLKSMGYSERYINNLTELVLLKARVALSAGCHGVVCSGMEVRYVKKEFGSDLITVCPGIRPSWSVVEKEDQNRIITPGQAVERGADYVVVGRPIRDADDPRAAAARITDEIASVIA